MIQLASAIVLIVGEGERILTVTNLAHGGIGMPGGKVEPDDASPMVAAVRELREETSLGVQLDDLVPVYSALWRFKRANGEYGPERRAHLYYAVAVSGQPTALEAGTQLEWVTFDELLSRSPFARYYQTALPFGVKYTTRTRGV